MLVARGAAKREEKQRGTGEEINLQANYWSPLIKKRYEPMKKQNTENEEKDRNTHRQETEEATGGEKVGEGAIRKRRIQEEIAIKLKIAENKDTEGKSRTKKCDKGEKYKNRKYLQCITGE